MAKEDDAIPGIIPKNEYKDDLEKDVLYHVARIGETRKVSKKIHRTEQPPKFTDKRQELDFQLDEIRKCIEGDGVMSGKMYFWYNYCWLRDPERGKIRPDFRTVDLDWFDTIEKCQKSKEWGVVTIKRRRVGASWKAAADALHDCTFTPYFQVGMNSKSENDSRNLFKHVKFLYQSLPDWLRPKSTASDRRDYMEFAWYEKDGAGNRAKKGNQSWILSVAPTDNAHEGNAYGKLIMDEAGKYDVMSMWQYSEDCLMINTRRVGMPLVFGTVGDITKEGRGLMEMWKNADAYKMKQFGLWGYNGLICDQYGNDMIEDAVRWIIYERSRRSAATQRVRDAFIQKYPLDERDAFNQVTAGGVGDPKLINDQIMKLMETPPLRVPGWMRIRNASTVDHIPDVANGEVIVYEKPDPMRINGYIAACLPPGETVLTSNGLKQIETVNKDDKLINEFGKLVDIKKFIIKDVVNEPLYTLKVSNTFRTTTFTSEHPILVSNHVMKRDYSNWRENRGGERYHEFDFKFKPVADVKVGDWTKIPVLYKEVNNDIEKYWDNMPYRIDRHINNPLLNHDFWWFIGLFLGDGYHAGYTKVAICFNEHETMHINRLTSLCKSLFNRSPNFTKTPGATVANICFKQLSDFLLLHFGNYSYGKKIPLWVKYLPIELKKQLVLGYLDSDGSITTSRNKYYYAEFVSVNLELLEDFQDILYSIGIIGGISRLRDKSIHSFGDRLCNTRPCYHLRLSHHNTVRLVSLINDKRSHKTTRIDLNNLPKVRKEPKNECFFDDSGDYIYFKIMDINKSVYTGEVYNFECDTNTFLCHHITTHNCDPVEDDDVAKTRDSSSMALAIISKPFGAQPAKLVLEYVARPTKLEEFFEQAAMVLRWYNNTRVTIEMNKGGWRARKYFEDKYPTLLALAPVSATSAKGGVEWRIGVKMTAERKEQMKGLIEDYVDHHVKFIPSIRLLEQFKVFGDNHADDDLAIAFGWDLILAQSDKTVVKLREENLAKNPTVTYARRGDGISLITNQKPQQSQHQHYKSALFKF